MRFHAGDSKHGALQSEAIVGIGWNTKIGQFKLCKIPFVGGTPTR
jgi:hypothetical protein